MKKFNFIIKDKLDDSSPEDNWFFYWKFAPSLWRDRLTALRKYETIFVPINWGWHHSEKNKIDFGQKSADRDLNQLLNIAKELNKEIIWLLPISPCPFMKLAGAPEFLKESLSQNTQNLNTVSLDADGAIVSHVSFFDPAVFESYHFFISELENYLSQNLKERLTLVTFNSIENSKLEDFFQDNSEFFEKGFLRFLKKQQVGREESQEIWEKKYRDEIKSLYLETCMDILQSRVSNITNFSVLGAGTMQFFMRSFSQDQRRSGYIADAILALENDSTPISVLLSKDELKTGVGAFINNILDQNFLSQKMERGLSEEEQEGFLPLSLFSLYGIGPKCWDQWENSKLLKHLHDVFPSLSLKKTVDDLEVEDHQDGRIYFFGGDINTQLFHKIINLFLMGADIFIDLSCVKSSIQKKLEVFLLENQLVVDHVKFMVPLRKASLAESSFYLYSSEDLVNINPKDQRMFWRKIIGCLNIKTLDTIEKDQNTFTFWQKRSGSPYELNYNDVRRLHLYNPTTDNRLVRIKPHKNFAFLKCAKEHHSKLVSNKSGLEINIGPFGHAILDYGHFENKRPS